VPANDDNVIRISKGRRNLVLTSLIGLSSSRTCSQTLVGFEKINLILLYNRLKSIRYFLR